MQINNNLHTPYSTGSSDLRVLVLSIEISLPISKGNRRIDAVERIRRINPVVDQWPTVPCLFSWPVKGDTAVQDATRASWLQRIAHSCGQVASC